MSRIHKKYIAMKKALSKLFQLRQALDACEKDIGLDHLSEVERAVFSFITSNGSVTITSITKHPYFAKYSLSTIKRAVLCLLNDGLIKSQKSKTDAREMHLTHSI
jgi:DNA-binding MarR family transcriptional regulator